MNPTEFLASIPPVQIEYWAEGKLVSRQSAPHPERFAEHGRYFVCNVCQEVWGWIYYPNRFWEPIYQDCSLHQSNRFHINVPGSLLAPWTTDLSDLPLAVLKREFEIHLNEWERRLKDEVPID